MSYDAWLMSLVTGLTCPRLVSAGQVLISVLGNSTEWIFDIRRLDRAQKGGFHYPYWEDYLEMVFDGQGTLLR